MIADAAATVATVPLRLPWTRGATGHAGWQQLHALRVERSARPLPLTSVHLTVTPTDRAPTSVVDLIFIFSNRSGFHLIRTPPRRLARRIAYRR
jgi:hypothetical protein